ncbi:MAG: thioredoxin family protein, partial [Flavobacteriales bacterium]
NVKKEKGKGKSEKGKGKSEKGKNSRKGKKGKADKKEEHNGPIDWMGWEEMVDTQQEDPGLVFIDIYTHWCGPCKLLDKKTFHDQKVASFINEHFHPVKMNAEMKDTIRFRGKNYKNTKPGFEKSSPRQRGKPHELPLKLVDGRLAYPTMVVLDKKMGRVKMIRGYKSPSKLLKALRPLVEEKKE